MKKLIIFGNGELAELAAFYFKFEQNIDTIGFVIDGKNLKETTFLNKSIIPLEEVEKNLAMRHMIFILQFPMVD